MWPILTFSHLSNNSENTAFPHKLSETNIYAVRDCGRLGKEWGAGKQRVDINNQGSGWVSSQLIYKQKLNPVEKKHWKKHFKSPKLSILINSLHENETFLLQFPRFCIYAGLVFLILPRTWDMFYFLTNSQRTIDFFSTVSMFMVAIPFIIWFIN